MTSGQKPGLTVHTVERQTNAQSVIEMEKSLRSSIAKLKTTPSQQWLGFYRGENNALYEIPTIERFAMENFLNKLKAQVDENPLVAIGIGIAAVTAASKFIDAAGAAYGRRTWAKEVTRRAKHAKR